MIPPDFARINMAALPALPALCARWLPGGKRVGREYIALNPTRADKRAGSFKVNLQTGRWADFATGDKGGDAVSLAAYLFGLRKSEAARRLAGTLGIAGGTRDG
jgi:DNA primase